MSPTKIVLASTAMVALLIMFATRPVSAPPSEPVVRAIPTEAILQPPFDTPSWVPDEITKRKALLRAYELNGNKMCCGSIDVTDMIDDPPPMPPDQLPPAEEIAKRFPYKTDQVTADAPAHAAAEVVDPNSRNALDAQAGVDPDWEGRRQFMNRTFRATRQQLAHHDENKPKDVCKRHGLHKVTYGDKWRCRK